MEARQKDLVNCLIDEIGSPVQKAMFEFTKGLTMIRAAAGLCRNVRGETIPSDRPGTFSMSIREPLGVVAVITPFNVPLIKTTRLVANALAVGNTVVHLPSEMAPHLSLIFAEIVEEAGIPDGVYNVVTGMGAEIGDDLTSHKDIDFLTFTGSTLWVSISTRSAPRIKRRARWNWAVKAQRSFWQMRTWTRSCRLPRALSLCSQDKPA